ncbi:hypothetical protein JMN32_14900, partial [Fulvivirga sp. 29W222]
MMKGNASFKLRYEASEENIDHKQFSYVTFIFRKDKGDKGRESYVVFEPSAPKARAIADYFGRKRYGDTFIESLVTPKNYQKKARVLFEEGKVITAADLTSEDAEKTEAIKKMLHNEHGVYMREDAGDNLEELIIPIPAKAKYKASIDLVKREDGSYSYGLSHTKAFGDYSGRSYAPSINSPVYPDRKSALQSALGKLKSFLNKERNANDASPTQNKMTGVALSAVVEFANGEGIELTGSNVEPIEIKPYETETTTIDDKLDEPTESESIKPLIGTEEAVSETTATTPEKPAPSKIIVTPRETTSPEPEQSDDDPEIVADFLEELFNQLQEGQQYHLLPFALTTMGKPEVCKVLAARDIKDLSILIASKDFRE